MTPRALIVLQARMGSRRLPGKVLASIGGRTVLAHCVRRLLQARVGPVVVATTMGAEDNPVMEEAWAAGALVHRGARDDVLARYLGTIEALGWDGSHLIRATADNPAVDIEAPGRMLFLLEAGADYAVEALLPVGAAVEGVRVSALRQAGAQATAPYDREHVTPWVRGHRDRFMVRTPLAPAALRRPDLRFTIDTPADLERMGDVFGRCRAAGSSLPALTALIRAADTSSDSEAVA